MKTKKILILITAVILFFGGCIPSLFPIYTEEDLVFRNELLGTWQEEGNSEMWIFEKADDDSYRFTYIQDSVSGVFEAHLTEMGGKLFFDFYPAWDDLSCFNDMMELHVFPVHTFAKVEINKDHIELLFFDHSWLQQQFKEHRIRISHKTVDDNILLTADTEELRKFFEKYANDENAYIDATVLYQIK